MVQSYYETKKPDTEKSKNKTGVWGKITRFFGNENNYSWEEIDELQEQWLKISYSINCLIVPIPNKSELYEKMDEVLQLFLQKFKEAQLQNLLNKGIIPKIILNETKRDDLIGKSIVFENDETSRHTFEVSVKKADDEGDYQFIINLKRTYSQNEYYFDGYTLYKTQEELCNILEISKFPNSTIHLNYDENNNPVIQHEETLIRLHYSMKDRIKFAIKDIEMDANCFGESVFIMVSNLEKSQHEYNKTWIKKVNILIDEELKRQNKTKKDFIMN